MFGSLLAGLYAAFNYLSTVVFGSAAQTAVILGSPLRAGACRGAVRRRSCKCRQDRTRPWPHRAADAARPRRRGDRIIPASACTLLHLLTAGYGTSRTSRDVRLESAKWTRPDIEPTSPNDRV